MILRGTPATISAQWFDADDPANPGTVTVGVTRADGTVLVAAGTATGGTLTDERTFALTPTHTASVDVLKATWASATHGTVTTYHPICGGFYVDLNTLRDSGDLSDETRFPDQTLADARRWWMDLVDDYCGQSFVPMYRLWKSPYPWRGGILRLDRPNVRAILSATVGGTLVDTTGWVASESGRVYTATGGNPTVAGAGFLQVAFEHGHNQPDAELYAAGVKAMRAKLLDDRVGGPLSRQLSITNEFGTTRIAQPGEDRATPWPDVNAVLNRRRSATEIVSIGA
jgi:hypothetical protein